MICRAVKLMDCVWSCESSCPYTMTCEIPKKIKCLEAEVERLNAALIKRETVYRDLCEAQAEVERLRTAATVAVKHWQAKSNLQDASMAALKDHL